MTNVHSWSIGSSCLIFSRTKEKWFEGEIIGMNGSNNDEWMTVEYNKHTKLIQRNCKFVKPIPFDHPSQFTLGSKCKIYSDITLSWCYGTIIHIFNDKQGEWLKVKYNDTNDNENSAHKICEIQRYSNDIRLIPKQESDEKKSAKANARDLEIFADIKHILINEETLKARIIELGNEITAYYVGDNYKNDELICIAILNGGFLFCADLIRHIKIAHRVEFMKVKSYSGSKQSDNIKVLLDINCMLDNKNVLIIEDLIDTGNTMMWLLQYLKSKKNAKSIKIACLLQKKTNLLSKDFNVKIDWIGFPNVANEWIVGYGMDYNDHYRHLPYIASLKESVYENDQ